MKAKSLAVTIVIIPCLVLTSAFAQDAAQVPQGTPSGATPGTQPGKNPKIRLDELVHSFGNVGPDTKNACRFRFCNDGDANLVIPRVDKSCGCTVAELDKKEYSPGECGELRVEYTAPRAAGVQTRYIYVNTNDPNNSRIQLTITATVVQKVNFEPDKLQFALRGNSAAQAKLTLRCVDDRPFSITSLRATGDAVTAVFDPAQKATEFVLTTTLTPEKMGGSLGGRIEVNITHPDCPTLIVPFTVLPQFTVSPSSINVTNAQPQQPVQKELWVLNNYGEDFEIESVTSSGNLVKVVSNEKIENRYKLNLEIKPPAGDGKSRVFSDTLTIAIKAPQGAAGTGGQKITVPCRGFYARQ